MWAVCCLGLAGLVAILAVATHAREAPWTPGDPDASE